MIELRDRELPRRVIERSGQTFRRLANTYSALFIVNDDPYLALELRADGVHIGQDDMDPAEARRIMGPDAIIGLSTHSREQIEAAGESPVDYISVGPIWETPTKEGRPATGLELIREAAETVAARPGSRSAAIDTGNVDQVVAGRCLAGLRGEGDPGRRGPAGGGHHPLRRRRSRCPGGDPALMAGARDRKRAERQKRKRRSSDRQPVPVDTQAQPAQDAAESNGDGAQSESFQERMARRYEERNAEARVQARAPGPGRAADRGDGRRDRIGGARDHLHRLGGPRHRGRGRRRA